MKPNVSPGARSQGRVSILRSVDARSVLTEEERFAGFLDDVLYLLTRAAAEIKMTARAAHSSARGPHAKLAAAYNLRVRQLVQQARLPASVDLRPHNVSAQVPDLKPVR